MLVAGRVNCSVWRVIHASPKSFEAVNRPFVGDVEDEARSRLYRRQKSGASPVLNTLGTGFGWETWSIKEPIGLRPDEVE